MAARLRGTVALAAVALAGTLGACSSQGDPASSPREKSRWQTESPSQGQLKKLLLSRSALPASLRQRYPQVFRTVDGGGRQVASKRQCQPLADALPGRLGGSRASAWKKRRNDCAASTVCRRQPPLISPLRGHFVWCDLAGVWDGDFFAC
ncbi:hypothetical protein GCM10009801_16550 [Streptomyces albiaxialis]|uniref:Lipoprotein n=1 Tax=Streptomyces albiaxialis TaxID=329523 RepID=A0ABN2VP46_9ACTN